MNPRNGLAFLVLLAGIATAQMIPNSPAARQSISSIFNTESAVEPLAASSPTLSFQYTIAHFPYQGGWSTQVFLANSGTQDATVDITFFNDKGASASVPLQGKGLQSSEQLTIHPNDVQVVGADTSKRNTGDLQVAWATAASSAPLNVFSLFDFGPNPPAISGAVGAQSTPPAKSYRFPVSVGGSVGFDAGMAIANPNGKTANVTVKVLNADGSQKGSFAVPLLANNQTIFTLKGKMSFGSSLFVGSVAVCSDQPIGLVTVGFEGGQAFFTTSVTNDPCP
jgi:hypothetical protein